MPEKTDPAPAVNRWMEEELYLQYQHDRQGVDPSWAGVFDTNGGGTEGAAPRTPVIEPPTLEPRPGDDLVPLRGAPARIAENMNASLSIPLATSQRTIPIKLMEENRRIVNQHRLLLNRSKVSFTHFIGYAMVKALADHPTLNQSYLENSSGQYRLVPAKVNVGIAVDVPGKDGAPSLLVPNLKDAASMSFPDFLAAYDELVSRARAGKLSVEDFQGTTISLTNPGTVGTVASVPRVMPGQGAILATGVADFPPEYKGVAAETRAMLGIGKVLTITCTYDHRVIQGAESGRFLGKIQELVQGEHGFYDAIFAELKMPHQPARWEPDYQPPASAGGRAQETAKESAVHSSSMHTASVVI